MLMAQTNKKALTPKCERWTYLWNITATVPAAAAERSYFRCDYTTKTCERGFILNSNIRVFELLAEDRTTIIGHGMCSGSDGICTDYDNGVWTLPNGRTMPLSDYMCHGKN
jgi:hypothetical protein